MEVAFYLISTCGNQIQSESPVMEMESYPVRKVESYQNLQTWIESYLVSNYGNRIIYDFIAMKIESYLNVQLL